jgi:hypothetical protein
MNLKLNSSDRLRIYGNGYNEVWQDIEYDNNSESLKILLYDHSLFEIYKYIEKHDNGYSTKGIIKIPKDNLDMRIKELEEKNIFVNKISL